MDAILRTTSLTVLLTFSIAVEGWAASVYVRLESVRFQDPLSIGSSDATHSASADLTTGDFRVLATAPVATTAVNTGAGIQEQLTFTNNNAFPFTIWAGTFRARIEGAYSVVPPGPSLATGTDSAARFAINTSGATGTTYSARFNHTLRANGNPGSDQNVFTPLTQSGATVVVSEASFTNLVVDLALPTFTLLPGQTMVFSFQVDATAQRNSFVDFFSTGGAQVAFDLPAGVVLDTNSSGPLDWVTVPEPDLLAGLATGWIVLVGMGRLGWRGTKATSFRPSRHEQSGGWRYSCLPPRRGGPVIVRSAPRPLQVRTASHLLAFLLSILLALTAAGPGFAAGPVIGWGDNLSSQTTPLASVYGSGTVNAISSGPGHSCAILSDDGAVVCWGQNLRGQAFPPPSVNGVDGSASAVAAGHSHSCAIQSGTGAVVCWGFNTSGQSTPPASVNGTSGTASAIAAGTAFSCAIQSGTGAVVCWGDNSEGQSTPPASVNGTSGTATAIVTGSLHACAIRAGTGAVVCWGNNIFQGQATPPASVNGVAGTATALAAGGFHSCAIRSGSGAVVCWGDNSVTAATPPAAVNGVSGTAVSIASSSGSLHTCAIQAGSNAVVCWGRNVAGEATPPASVNGISGTAAAIAPGGEHSCAIQSGSSAVVCWGGDNFFGQRSPPASADGTGETATTIAAGGLHSCAIRSSTGGVGCWGENSTGQATPPITLRGTNAIGTAIATGGSHSCAIRDASIGAVVCWGNNGSGRATPPNTVNGTSGQARAIAAGEDHSCAIRSNSNAVVCWGSNGSGQATPPTSVNGTAGTATAIAAGGGHSCAIRAGTGAVVCWGANGAGESTPPPSVDGTSGSATAIAAGDDHSCAIRSGTGIVVCWGANGSGQSTPPGAVNATTGTASAISAANANTCAIQAYSHAVVCWGSNVAGKSTPPAAVDGTSGGASAIAAGGGHGLAISTPVPEPGVGLSLMSGMLLLAALRVRIGKQRSPESEAARRNGGKAGATTRCIPARAVFAVLVTWATALVSTAAPHPIVDRVYHCTRIARAQDLAPFRRVGLPSINAYGQVAFATSLPTDPFDSEIRVGYGDEVNGAPQTRRVARGSTAGGTPFTGVGGPSIDNSGRVAFFGGGFLPPFFRGLGIFRVPFNAYDGSLPTPLVETRESNPASQFDGNFGPLLAGTHDVMFWASYFPNGAPPYRVGLFRNDVLELEVPSTEYVYDAGPSRAYAYLTDSGTYPNLVLQLFLRTQQIDSVPVETGWISGLSVATSVSGSVSYFRFQDTGFEVRVWAGVPRVYVDSDDDALFADVFGAFQTSINPYGEVALAAGDENTRRRVFMADGDVIHRVRCENDLIYPENIGSRAINAAGQIAFIGRDFGSGQFQDVIARADPLQGLPSSCVGVSAGSPCDDGDSETAALCSSGGQCVGDPIGRPTSCLLEPDDTPCDDGNPATLAYCESAACVAVPLAVPEPDARASLLAAMAVLALLRRRGWRAGVSKRPLLGLLVGSLTVGSFVGAERAEAARSIVDRNYDCKIIASTQQFPLGVDTLGPPAMNAWGQVVFQANTVIDGDNVAELRVGRGDQSNGVPITHVAASGGGNVSGPSDPPAPFASVDEGAIDGAGRVTFVASRHWWTGGGVAIYRSDPASGTVNSMFATKDIDSFSPFLAFDLVHTLGVSASGSIVFQGVHETDGTAFYRNGVEVARNYSNGVQIVNAPVLLHAGQPWTAYKGSILGGSGGTGIWVNGALWVASVNGAGGFAGLSLSGSASPVIAYSRSGFAGIDSWELVVTGALGTTVFVDADEDPFFSFAAPLQTATNVWSEVAFISTPVSGGKSLLVADGGQQIRRVVCQNQLQTFGGLFSDVTLSPHGMNADGQIAFRGRNFLATYLVRADPLPGQGAPPTSCTGQLEGARCDDGDPITQSSCQANFCQGNPLVDPPTSCVGVEDDTACNDGDSSTISYCNDEVCVGFPLPVPEPSSTWLGFVVATAMIASLQRPRPGPERENARSAVRGGSRHPHPTSLASPIPGPDSGTGWGPTAALVLSADPSPRFGRRNGLDGKRSVHARRRDTLS